MTEQQTSTTAGRSMQHSTAPRRPSGAWRGWVRFGGVLMIVVGGFSVIEGLLALFRPTTYIVSNQAVLTLTYTGWGWLHLVLGALVLLVGVALLGEVVPGWARGTAIVLIAINAIVQLAWLPAYPIWSIVMIVLDVLVLGALVAIGDRRARIG